MGFLKNLKAIKDQVAAGMSGQGPTEEALAALSPEQRAAYDAQLAQAAAAERQVAEAQVAARTSRPLFGPAGDYVYGLDPYEAAAAAQRILEEGGGVKAYFKAAWKAPVPGSGGDARTLPEVRATYADPHQQAAHERSQRDEARRPYLVPDGVRFPVVFTRIASTAKDELDDVVAHLASSGLAGRPELVFGAYRVPDHIGSSLTAGRRYVEWDVVHAATGPLPPAAAPATTHLDDTERWVARASGEPSVLDEDLGVAVLAAAGVGPERCTGIARSIGSVSAGADENSGGHGYVMIHVQGIELLHPADAHVDVQATVVGFRRTGPLALPLGPPAGVHVEVLNWRAIDKAVRAGTGVAPSVPSPFPHLPSTPQELLSAYLEIVGVNPFDAYGAAVTEDQPRDIRWVRRKGIATVSTDGQSQPCADGQSRSRLGGGRLVVITYRDRPTYAEGRQRWDAYQTEVLQARLGQGTGARRPVEAMAMGSLPSGFRRLAGAVEKVADAVDYVVGEGTGNTLFDRIAPHRYCWPPTDIR